MTLIKWLGGLTIAVALAVAPGAWVRSSHGAHVTGDEPQYLMTAQSLAADGDLDVSNQRADQSWKPFHEIGPPLVQETVGASGRQVSPHDPLLPAVLAGPVELGGWRTARLALAAAAGALAAVTAWVAHRRFGVDLRLATLTAGVFAVAAPLAVYGTQVYPELPAALVLTAGMAIALGPARLRTAAGVGAAVVALPWLSVKYVPVAAALAAVTLVRMWRSEPRLAVVTGGGLVLAGVAYVAAHQVWYDGWTVYAAGDHFASGELTVAGHDPDYVGRSTRLLGLVTDRQFGLAVWQPAYLLAIPGLAWLARRRPPGWLALVLPLAAGWLTAAFVALTMHGWWFPGRQTVVVLPAAVVAVAVFAHHRRWARRAVTAAGLLGVTTYGVLLVEGLAGRITWAVDFHATVAPVTDVLGPVLPDYRSSDPIRWALHGAWFVLACALAAAGWRAARPSRLPAAATAPAPVHPIEPIPIPGPT